MTSDRKLVITAQRGDQRARDALVSRYLPFIYNWAGRASAGVRTPTTSSSRVLLRVVRHLPGLRDAGQLRAWIGAIAVARISAFRMKNRNGRIGGSYATNVHVKTGQGPQRGPRHLLRL